MKFTLTNQFKKNLSLYLEPEGDLVEMSPDQSVEIEVEPGRTPAFDLQIGQEDDNVIVKIWFENHYEVSEGKYPEI